MKNFENKRTYAELKREIAQKKAILINKRSEYNATLTSLNKIAKEIENLEHAIFLLES